MSQFRHHRKGIRHPRLCHDCPGCVSHKPHGGRAATEDTQARRKSDEGCVCSPPRTGSTDTRTGSTDTRTGSTTRDTARLPGMLPDYQGYCHTTRDTARLPGILPDYQGYCRTTRDTAALPGMLELVQLVMQFLVQGCCPNSVPVV